MIKCAFQNRIVIAWPYEGTLGLGKTESSFQCINFTSERSPSLTSILTRNLETQLKWKTLWGKKKKRQQTNPDIISL